MGLTKKIYIYNIVSEWTFFFFGWNIVGRLKRWFVSHSVCIWKLVLIYIFMQELNINTNSIYILRAVLSAVSGIKSLGTGNIYTCFFLYFLLCFVLPQILWPKQKGKKTEENWMCKLEDIHFSGFLTLPKPENWYRCCCGDFHSNLDRSLFCSTIWNW